MLQNTRASLFISLVRLVLLTLVFASLPALSQDCGCDAVLIPSISWIKTNSQYQLDILKIMDKETYNSISNSADAGFTVPIKAVPVKFDGDWNQFQESREKIFTQEGYNTSSRDARDALSKSVPEANVHAWESCKQLCATHGGSSGLYCQFVNQDQTEATLLVQTGPTQVTIESTQMSGAKMSDNSLLAKNTTLAPGTSRKVIVERDSQSTNARVAINGSGYTCDAVWAGQAPAPPPPVQTRWRARLNQPMHLTSSGCISLALTDDNGSLSTRFFDAPTEGEYQVTVHSEGPFCPECYYLLMELYKADNPATNINDAIMTSPISTDTKAANWDGDMTVHLKQGEGLKLRACPCGNEHCKGNINSAVSLATVDIQKR
jgi:hypothetical protein